MLRLSQPSYQAVKRILERHAAAKAASAAADKSPLQQHSPHIRAIEQYQAFWDEYCRQAAQAAPDSDPIHP